MALSGLALIATFGRGEGLGLFAYLVIFFGLMWVYLLDASAKNSPEDEVNQRPRYDFFQKHSRFLSGLRFICLLVALWAALSLHLDKSSWVFLAGAAVLSWLYSVGFKGRRLKNFSLNKTWLVALAWTPGVYGVGS